MKKYKVFKISFEAKDTEEELNKYAKDGWRLICSYAFSNSWLILEKEE